MADNKHNVTVIIQEPKPSTPGAGTVLWELLVFIACIMLLGIIGGCSAWRLFL